MLSTFGVGEGVDGSQRHFSGDDFGLVLHSLGYNAKPGRAWAAGRAGTAESTG